MLNTMLIREKMQQLGLSQSALAAQCKVSKEAVSNWLSGESIPRPNKARSLSDALSLTIEALFSGPGAVAEPIVAYRMRRNRPATGAAKEAAEDVGRHLRELVPFIQRDVLFVPPVLERPVLDEDYIRAVAGQVRSRVGLSPTEPLTRAHLFELHRHFGSILVPVLWDKEKDGHENALSVLLPDSKTSWVLFSLNAKDDDFNYWLAHELGHGYSLHVLQDDAGEQFAELFAQELLFPLAVAEEALNEAASKSVLRERATWYAGRYAISIITVVKQMDKAAERLGIPATGLLGGGFWAEWSAGRKHVPTVAECMLGSANLTTEEYVVGSEDVFGTPIFRALTDWQTNEGGRSPAFIRAALNLHLNTAVELSQFLMKRQELASA